jgi:integral membrane protein (TIGR00529 family)
LLDAFKLLLVFAFIVLLLMRRTNLGVVLGGSAIVLGLLFGLSAEGFWQSLVQTATSASNLELMIALVLLMVLQDIMRRQGILQCLVTSLRGLVGDSRVAMAVLPSLVGLIPSAGGAIFSAPMIEEMSQGSGATAEDKTFINYWFRHLWEYVLPLHPALLLAAQVYGVSFASFAVLLLPVPALVFIVGWFASLRGLKSQPREAGDAMEARPLRDLAVGVGPLAAILVLVLALRTSIPIAVALVLAVLVLACRYGPRQLAGILREAVSLNVLFSVFTVLLFKETLLVSNGVHALTPLSTSSHVPLIVLFAVFPCLVGILTGSPQAVIGASGPILLSIAGLASVPPSWVAVATVSGYAGCMLSPAHLCLVLTTGYFHADFGKVYRMVILPELALVAVTFGYLALV